MDYIHSSENVVYSDWVKTFVLLPVTTIHGNKVWFRNVYRRRRKLLADIPQLTDILKHHVVGDSVMSSMLSNGQIVTTLAGTDLTVTIDTSGVYIDGAQVTVADVVFTK